jgi:hypothetical protein
MRFKKGVLVTTRHKTAIIWTDVKPSEDLFCVRGFKRGEPAVVIEARNSGTDETGRLMVKLLLTTGTCGWVFESDLALYET